MRIAGKMMLSGNNAKNNNLYFETASTFIYQNTLFMQLYVIIICVAAASLRCEP